MSERGGHFHLECLLLENTIAKPEVNRIPGDVRGGVLLVFISPHPGNKAAIAHLLAV
jgi:hypothetical protein